jgi:hypothetical protein
LCVLAVRSHKPNEPPVALRGQREKFKVCWSGFTSTSAYSRATIHFSSVNVTKMTPASERLLVDFD